jgi:EAL domain-containing protein (putative c-di-GMP-specific phosphodiesterase class I)
MVDALKSDIIAGLAADQFIPFFQPQIAGRSGKLVGLEALIRWNHPKRGLLTPYHFLDIAEEAGLLDELDRRVNAQVFAAARRWADMGLDVGRVSINITPARLNSETVVTDLLASCDQAGIAPAQVGLEILESAMIEDQSQRMIENAAKLATAGFRLELDDFGTGHASVANLRFLPISQIKIDKSFIIGLHHDTDLSMIVAALIGMAHNLRIDVLAEGVERPEERLILNALGCDRLQGFGICRPIPADEVPQTIARMRGTHRTALMARLKS